MFSWTLTGTLEHHRSCFRSILTCEFCEVFTWSFSCSAVCHALPLQILFSFKIIKKQVCIPVGCVPSAAVAVCWVGVCSGGGLTGGVCPQGLSALGVYPSMHCGRQPPCGQNSLHTLVKILYCRNFVADGNNMNRNNKLSSWQLLSVITYNW